MQLRIRDLRDDNDLLQNILPSTSTVNNRPIPGMKPGK
mgnify:CR=1 FL=1